MVEIDGAMGEGGGQVLRSSLALSVVTGRPFRIHNLRSGRQNPGLRRQHLTAVQAAAEVAGAQLRGAEIGSRSLSFKPRRTPGGGSHHFSVGTAGSATLVLQTVLPPLLLADAPSVLILGGGARNPGAPPFEFIERAYAPLLWRMGARLELALERPGFFPAGGGRFTARISPATQGLRPLELIERGAPLRRRATALLSKLPDHIAQRELRVVQEELGWRRDELVVRKVPGPRGPGNALLLEFESEGVTELVTGFGKKGLPAERVARAAAAELTRYLSSPAPVGEHLADQLILLLALAGGGRFRTGTLTPHARTQQRLIPHFLEVDIQSRELAKGLWEVEVAPQP
jgi:RNA 3'-terminal phosphate cyclase (ATP)